MRGPHWLLFNAEDRWRLAGHADVAREIRERAAGPAGEKIPDVPPPTAAEMARDPPFTVRMAKAAADEVSLESFSSDDTRQRAHLGMLGRLVNMAVSRTADDAREALTIERNTARELAEKHRVVDPLRPGDDESSDSEDEGFLDAEALAEIDTRGLLADSKDAAEAERLYKQLVLDGGATAGTDATPWSAVGASPVASDQVEDVEQLPRRLAAANKKAVDKLRGLTAPADAPEASPFVGDGEAEESGRVIPEPADARAAMDTSDDGDLTKWDIGRTRGGLTLEETCRTGAKDHAAGTEYGAPLNERQAVAVRLILRNFEARRLDPSGARRPPSRVLVTGPPGTGKSVVMKAVRRHYHSWGRLSEVRCGAPTGSAAFKIYGRTTTQLRGGGRKGRLSAGPAPAPRPPVARHARRGCIMRALGRFSTRVREIGARPRRSRAKLEEEYRTATLLMVDEVSMQSLEFVDRWDDYVNKAKNAPAGAFFGDMDLVWFGDFAQFPALGGHSLYTFSKIIDDESLTMAARVNAIERKVKATNKKSRLEIATEIVRAIQK